MKFRVVAALAVFFTALVASTAVSTASAATEPVAVLIDVDVIRPQQAGPPGGGANCTNAGADSGTWTPTGWTVGGPRTAYFNTTTLPSDLGLSATVSALQSSFSAWTGAPSINVVTSTTSATTKTANRNNIGMHEAGHVYGLGHPSGARFETMYATGFSGETLKRSPASGDRAGINALY